MKILYLGCVTRAPIGGFLTCCWNSGSVTRVPINGFHIWRKYCILAVWHVLLLVDSLSDGEFCFCEMSSCWWILYSMLIFWLCDLCCYWWLPYLMLRFWFLETSSYWWIPCCYWWLPYLTLRSRFCEIICYDWICYLMSGWWMCGVNGYLTMNDDFIHTCSHWRVLGTTAPIGGFLTWCCGNNCVTLDAISGLLANTYTPIGGFPIWCCDGRLCDTSYNIGGFLGHRLPVMKLLPARIIILWHLLLLVESWDTCSYWWVTYLMLG